MVRVYTHANNEAIGVALRIIRAVPRHLLAADWVIGADVVWQGDHEFDETDDGRTFRNTPHVAHPWHLNDCRSGLPLLVLPVEVEPWVVLHELGHVIDFHMGFDRLCVPCTWYANTDRQESFAEAFTAWALPWYAKLDQDDRAFFDAVFG